MKILHVTPHLGGGVGKAHAALSAAFDRHIERSYALLEAPRETRYAAQIEAQGAPVSVVAGLHELAYRASLADIVQFEFWNHPRMFECLARCGFAPMRSVFWSHISGLSAPLIPPGLVAQAGRFVLTTEASRAVAKGDNVAVINSGFGFDSVPRRHQNPPVAAYLGTADFVKMHPGFFAAADLLDDIELRVWGEPSAEVVMAWRAMRHRRRVTLCGATSDPAAALAEADIFFYPLRRGHYGTAENVLVEAMSLGLVPVVLDNAAECAIVQHGDTGFVGRTIEECAAHVRTLAASPPLLKRLSADAAQSIAASRTPARSAQAFTDLWQDMLRERVRPTRFPDAIGDTPAAWFATQGVAVRGGGIAAKGSLAHFESVFGAEPSLARLRA